MPVTLQAQPLASTARALRHGELNLYEYIDQTCARLRNEDALIKAFLPENARRNRLRAEAALLERRYPDPATRPPLFGILLGVKDIFQTNGFPTRAGSALPATLFEGNEAICVSQLRAAGALVLGKTVTAEFAYLAPGATRNPHNLEHTPGGSSSGSAAAVAAGFCPLAVGTQTVGSVIRPAAYCGVVGFKPTFGRIATKGVLGAAPSLDTVGLFTQDIEGMKLAAALVCKDWQIQGAPEKTPKPIVAVPEGPYLAQTTGEALAIYYQQIASLEKADYQVRKIPVFAEIASIARDTLDLFAQEMAEIHRDWFAAYAPLYQPLTSAHLIRGQQFGPERLKETRASQARLRKELTEIMEREHIDLWLAPSATGPAPESLQTTGDSALNLPWNTARLPVVTIPVSALKGLPLGLQLIARAGKDEDLLNWAALLAQHFRYALA